MGCDLFVSPTGFYKKSFNPRTHVGCDREWLFDFAIPEVFQSTHPRGVRQISVNTINQRGRFNPRTHVGCDTTIAIIRAIIAGFNPRTHVGCDRSKGSYDKDFESFNPRTHVGCDRKCQLGVLCGFVSIHAPTWGATCAGVKSKAKAKFQSTHPRGVRHGHHKKHDREQRFNPRTHVGCDSAKTLICSELEVSIHAPTWGAT